MLDLRALTGLYDDTQSSLSRRLSSLAREAGGISRSLERFGDGARHDVSHFAHDAADIALRQGSRAARAVGKQAWRAGRQVGKDPVPAVVAVAGLACLVSLVMSSGKAAARNRR
jgi:hypothetical protein